MFSFSNAKIMVSLLSGPGKSAGSGGNDDLTHYLMHQADEREAARGRRWWPGRIIAMMRAGATARRDRERSGALLDSAAHLMDDIGIASRGHGGPAGAAAPIVLAPLAEDARQPAAAVPARMRDATAA